jgi:hypothetical protein
VVVEESPIQSGLGRLSWSDGGGCQQIEAFAHSPNYGLEAPMPARTHDYVRLPVLRPLLCHELWLFRYQTPVYPLQADIPFLHILRTGRVTGI